MRTFYQRVSLGRIHPVDPQIEVTVKRSPFWNLLILLLLALLLFVLFLFVLVLILVIVAALVVVFRFLFLVATFLLVFFLAMHLQK